MMGDSFPLPQDVRWSQWGWFFLVGINASSSF